MTRLPTRRIPHRISHRRSLELSTVLAVAAGDRVAIDPTTLRLLNRRRQEISTFIHRSQQPAYGFNRGFGHNVDSAVDPSLLAELQTNLIRSHSAGVGNLVPVPVVRATMFLRAFSLARGHSGIRGAVVQQIIAMLNAGITPAVPRYGSVGASGDLAPLSHIALALIGEGSCIYRGRVVPTSQALRRSRIRPLALEMKEGLALNNGVQFSTALGILAAHEMLKLIRVGVVATALSCQVMLGSDDAYGTELMKLRPHPGAQKVARWLRALMANSPLRKAHRSFDVDGEVQDPYNLRCAPQILGTCLELIEDALDTFMREANSVTDNPLLLPNRKDRGRMTHIVSGGHFHGMPVAVKLYSVVQAASIMARLSNMRCVRYVDECRNRGLGSDLIWPELSEKQRSISSGMMIPEYVSAALTNEIWGLSMPSHLFSLSTDAGQEDHVSMSATLGMRVHDILPRLAEVLAIELAFAHQGAAIRRVHQKIPSKRSGDLVPPSMQQKLRQLEREASASLSKSKARFQPRASLNFEYRLSARECRLSTISERVLTLIQRYFPTVRQDRELSTNLGELAAVIRSGEFLSVVPEKLWN